MSYRIAHVRFTKTGQLYPVNCNRADLDTGDIVVVRIQSSDRQLQVAEVDRVEFLNWRCKNTILCKRSEFQSKGAGRYTIKREAAPQGIETIEELERELSRAGWLRTRLSSHVYRCVFIRDFDNTTAAIGIRRNGIDFQIYDEKWNGDIVEGPRSFPDGVQNLVRHNFYISEVDLLELTKHFALSADQPFNELEQFFQPIGQKQPRPESGRDDLHDIAEAIGGAMTDTERDAFGS